jgi:phosphate uptake regulator
MEFRKVQVTGGNSFVVSLPKAWVKEVGLKAKDAVGVVSQADSSLLIIPRREAMEGSRSEGVIHVPPGSDWNAVLRQFISFYLAGYDTIRVASAKYDAPMRGFIREGIRRKLVGVEIVEESASGILTQCLSGYSDLPLKKALERMAIISGGMVEDAVESLRKGDKELAAEVVQRDDEVDRFYHFILRQLNIAVMNRSVIQAIGLNSARDCLGYRLAAKSVERVADHAASIAAQAELVGPVQEAAFKKIEEMASRSRKTFHDSVSSLLRLDAKVAEESISGMGDVTKLEERLTREILAPRMAGNQVASFKLILEDVRRVSEYSADIAEIAIDLNVKEPQQA